MPKHKDQRVGIFVDVQNLYYSAKQLYSAKVNFAHILERAVAGRKLIRAIAYVIKADIKEEHNFFEALEKIGYDVRSKDLQTFYTGAKKGDWDVGIAMDIMRMASKLDVIVLISGDGDFKDLLEHVKALGCRAEVIAFGKTSSSRLIAEADEVIDLAKELDKVLIRGNSKSYRTDYKKNKSNRSNNDSSNGNKDSDSKNSSNKSYNKKSSRKRTGRKDYKKTSHSSSGESASFMQKINMDQPDIGNDKSDKKLVMPEEENKQEKKTTKKKPPAKKKSSPKKKTVKKKTDKKGKK